MILRRRAAAVLAVLGLMAGCSGLSNRQKVAVVEAEGWALLNADKPAWETRQRAIAEAQKRAVESAAGVSISARTKVDMSVTRQQTIQADVGGYIRKYKILSARKEAGFLKIRIVPP